MRDTNTNAGFQGKSFSGTFDGTGHKISNLVIDTNGTKNRSYLGLFGYINNGVVKNLRMENVNIVCNNGPYYAGGLAGLSNYGDINNCCSTGSIISAGGTDEVGGLVGVNEYGNISNCASTVSVNAGNYAFDFGGLVGDNYGGAVINCYATGNVEGTSKVRGEYLSGFGGLIGYNNLGEINDCWASGNVTGTTNASLGAVGCWFGGLVGDNDGIISRCCATGNVTGIGGAGSFGGLAGINESSISNCYAMGNVTGVGSNAFGGLTGSNGGNISNCYSVGFVSVDLASSYFGGLLGLNSGAITASFWDVQTSGQTTSAGGTGKTTAEMKTLSTFTDAGWDFIGETINGTEDIWWILDGITYPKLAWQRTPNGGGCCPGGGGYFYPADYNTDNFVNFIDFAIFANTWQTQNPFISLDADTDVDIYDLKIFCESWLL